MPRKLKSWSKIAIFDIADHSSQSLSSLDKLVGSELKISGRGNRVRLEGIAKLVLALKAVRQGTSRLKVINLNTSDLENPSVISALDSLGILARALNNKQRDAIINGTMTIDTEVREGINRAAHHSMKLATKYL